MIGMDFLHPKALITKVGLSYGQHTYEDGRTLYQYTEYKLDETGEPFTIEENKFAISDQYLINEESFELVKKYLMYEIDMPYSFYNFETNELETVVKKNVNQKSSKKIINLKFCQTVPNIDVYGQSTNAFIGYNSNKNYPCEKSISYKEFKKKTSKKDWFYCYNEKTQLYLNKHTITGLGYGSKECLVKKNDFNIYPINNSDKFYYLKNKGTLVNLTFCKRDTNYQGGYANVELRYLINPVFSSYSNNCASISTQDFLTALSNQKENILCFNSDNPPGSKILYETDCSGYKNSYEIVFDGDNFVVIDLFDKTLIAEIDSGIKLGNSNSNLAQLENDKLKNIRLKTDENYYALVIGNNNYQHLEKLDAAENDAKVIADVLKNKYGFKVNLLLNADYDTTVNSLFAITSKLKKNDNLLIYYAGHGELDKAENRGYWLPVDASYELRSKWVSNQRIVDRVKATKAKHVLLMIDSCFSGALMRGGNLIKRDISIDEKYILRLKNKKTRLVITSGGNEPVIDSDGGSHSLFAYKLIETLKQNKDVINSQYLFENIRKYVIANTDQTPELALVHKTGHDGGDFLFFPVN